MVEAPLTLRSKLRRALAQLRYLPRAWGLVWGAARYWTLAWAALLVVQGLLPVATVYLTRQVVDGLDAALGAPGQGWGELLPTLALLATLTLLARILGSLSVWVRAAQSELVRDRISELIQGQSLALDLAFYESPDYYDRLHRARNDARYRPLALLDNAGSLVQNGITLVAMAAVLLRFGLLLPAAMLISAIPALYAALHHSQREHQWTVRTTPDQRRAIYYDWLLTSAAPAAEVRLFGLGAHFQGAYQALRARLRGERIALARDQVLLALGAGVAALLLPGLALGWMVWQATQGRYSLGDLAMLYQSFNQGQGLIRAFLDSLGQVYSNSLFLGDLFDFLALRPAITSPTRPPTPRESSEEAGGVGLREGVRFRQVSFQYPHGRSLALRELDLTLPAGRTVAIVGANGAGKSTLIKLLCRLYDPTAGAIEMDGVDLRALPLDELRRMVTVLMQEPVRYHGTVAENISVGDLAASQRPGAVPQAAQAAGADEIVGRLPEGYGTLLSTWFSGGTDLSGGEWQRLALARAFLRQAPLIILDEPTSAMDSWAEQAWLERFAELARGRTVLLITHRFTTAMRADIIHVMSEGRIVESGSHRELMELGGRYAASWRAQMQRADWPETRPAKGEPSP